MSSKAAVAVFGSSATIPESEEWADAQYVGARLATSGVAVITGGYGGTMEAVSQGASGEGGEVIGVTAPPLFPDRAGPNPHVTQLVETTGLVERIGTMMDRAEGVIALPGSIGTATELLVAWNLNYLARRNGEAQLPTAAVGQGWKSVVQSLVEGTGADGGDVHLADTGAEAVSWLLHRLNIP